MEPVYVTVGTDYEEDGVFIVGFADEDSLGVVFSQPDTVDEQASLLGLDSYCGLRLTAGATFYGGVESARVDGTELALRFTPGAAETAGSSRVSFVLRFEDEACGDRGGRRSAPGRRRRRSAASASAPKSAAGPGRNRACQSLPRTDP